MEPDVKIGSIYKHYKGDLYKILNLVKHTETEEWMVVYERQTDITHTGWRIWARPFSMFEEAIDISDYRGPRFVFVSEN